jgi:hypothetical protein
MTVEGDLTQKPSLNLGVCAEAILRWAPLKLKMAGPTRLELATSGVTGRRSNQLNYDPTYLKGSE